MSLRVIFSVHVFIHLWLSKLISIFYFISNVKNNIITAVSTLAPGLENDILLSGSWDKTAIVWKIAAIGEPSFIQLKGHEAAVWSVCALKSGKFVTGSADKSIIYWNKSGRKLKVLKSHNDCVRSLLCLPNDSIISASNDAVIKIWNEDGECIRELEGHTNYIYSICFNYHLGENVFVSGRFCNRCIFSFKCRFSGFDKMVE